jgi:hypothetical protein
LIGTPVAHVVYGVPQTLNTANYVYFLALQEMYASLALFFSFFFWTSSQKCESDCTCVFSILHSLFFERRVLIFRQFESRAPKASRYCACVFFWCSYFWILDLIESLVFFCLFLVYADTYIVVIDSCIVVLLSRFWFCAYFWY